MLSTLFGVHRNIEKWGDTALTLMLIFMALVLLVIALRGSTGLKAIAAAYVYLP